MSRITECLLSFDHWLSKSFECAVLIEVNVRKVRNSLLKLTDYANTWILEFFESFENCGAS